MAEKEIKVLVQGCRVRLLTDLAEFEGTLASFDVGIGFITIKNAICISDNKAIPKVLNFMKNEIVKLTIISVPKKKTNRATDPEATKQETPVSKPHEVLSNTLSNSVSEISETFKKSEQEKPGKLKESEDCRSTQGNLSMLSRKPFCDKSPTEQALLGGVLPRYSETASLRDDGGFTSNYLLLEAFSDDFCMAVKQIKSSTVIGLAMQGKDLGRKGHLAWIEISTREQVFLFDVLSFGESNLLSHLQPVFENENILKVVHDCREMSDLLSHRHQVMLVNVFDTQVASVIVFHRRHGCFPRTLDPLIACVLEHLNLSYETIWLQKTLAEKFKSSSEIWNVRPATDAVLEAAAFNVRHLRELRFRLMEEMLRDFVDGVDIYLGLFRDADDSKLEELQNVTHILPMEFKDLRENGEASRRMMEEFCRRDPLLRGIHSSAPTVDKFIAVRCPASVQNFGIHTMQDCGTEKRESPQLAKIQTLSSSSSAALKEETTQEPKPSSSSSSSTEPLKKMKGSSSDRSPSRKTFTLRDAVKLCRATAPKSDHLIMVAAGHEPSVHISMQGKKKSKAAASQSLTSNAEKREGSDISHSLALVKPSRQVNVLEDFSAIPSQCAKGQCTTDRCIKSNGESTAKRSEVVFNGQLGCAATLGCQLKNSIPSLNTFGSNGFTKGTTNAKTSHLSTECSKASHSLNAGFVAQAMSVRSGSAVGDGNSLSAFDDNQEDAENGNRILPPVYTQDTPDPDITVPHFSNIGSCGRGVTMLKLLDMCNELKPGRSCVN